MGLIVKICGLTSDEALDAALSAGADMVGIVRFKPSPRYLDLTTAARLAARAKDRVESVLVTVNMTDGELDETVEAVRPDWIQFHGQEPPDRVAAAAARTGRRVMKAVGVATAEDLGRTIPYGDAVDMLVLDAKPPKEASRPGGHGVAFDWSIVANRVLARPYLLSGGLTADNVAAAAAATGAAGVDVSSGVERAPGIKDPDLIRGFVAAARGATAPQESESLAL